MIYLYSENFNFKEKIKSLVKVLIGRSIRGPQAVLRSLELGLKENGVVYKLNSPLGNGIDVACVLSNASTLRWAIAQKKLGKIKKIIAGPNIAISPNDDGGIWRDKNLDVIIVPSLWVKEHYINEAPELAGKIQIWAAGVEKVELKNYKKTIDFLLYNKLYNNELVGSIKKHLNNLGFKVVELVYGKFTQAEYFKLLEQAKFEIYISESESQGLGMFEAWARNVPIFVWERGFWKAKNYSWKGNTASPYVAEQLGDRFKDFEEFKLKLPTFMKSDFAPKYFVDNNFTNKISAEKYLSIYNSIK